MSNDLHGKVAIVTGGAHGIGKAYAARLATDGADVAIADIDGDAACKAASELQKLGLTAVGLNVDVAQAVSVDAMASAVIDRFGRIDILVNNAAIFKSIPVSRSGFEGLSIEEFEEVLRVNVIGVWLCTKAVVDDMRKRHYGKIVNVSSTRALRATNSAVGSSHYATSKAAVLGLTRCLARELGADGIRVNSIAPGSTMSDDDLDESTLQAAIARGQFGDRALQSVQTPDDLVGVLAFLASTDSDFITGQTIVVDGGSYMH